MSDKRVHWALIAIIFIAAIYFRFNGINWDQGYMLHPDERFVVMVTNAMTLPESFIQYMIPAESPMNARNVGYDFFVYGSFPLILVKLLAVGTDMDTYNNTAILGRAISALFDILVVVYVFKMVQLLEHQYKLSRGAKYAAAGLYAVAVLPIQLSHFYAVDTFSNFFTFASIYYAMAFYFKPRFVNVMLSAIMIGLGVASKVSSIYLAPLIAIFFILPYLTVFLKHKKKLDTKKLGVMLLYGAGFVFFSYLTLRFANPYYFEDGNLFAFHLSDAFLQNIRQLESFSAPDAWFPPAVQWINKTPVWFALYNLILAGVGVGFFITSIAGMVITLRSYRKTALVLLLIASVAFFLYQSITALKTIRYFIYIYPFLAIFGGIALAAIWRIKQQKLRIGLSIAAVSTILIWPVMFNSIYMYDHSRVQASYWIYQNLPGETVLLSEHWDDGLPLMIPEQQGKIFIMDQLPVFDPDTAEKWEIMNSKLENADYYILSSNRGWGSITTVPERYPRMTQFYTDLFAGKTSYKQIAQITSYPSLRYLGIPVEFPDGWLEESFTVYDHPEVYIFENTSK
jgi:hypothetical protein